MMLRRSVSIGSERAAVPTVELRHMKSREIPLGMVEL
jgi:hypothetical protein